MDYSAICISKIGVLDKGTVTVFLAVLGATLWLYSSVKTRRRWSGKTRPPGPRSLPVLGNLLAFINTDPRAQLTRYAEQYGDIFCFRLGSEEIVVLNSTDVIREALIKKGNLFVRRPDMFFVEHIIQGKGIISANGRRWREQRRYTHTVLKDFGMGRSLLEDRVLEEVSFYLQELEHRNGVPQDIFHLTSAAVSNVINSVVFGLRFDYKDEEFQNILRMFSESFKILGNAAIINFFPFLRFIPGDVFSVGKVASYKEYIDEFTKGHIQRHKDCQNEGTVTDLIDAYLRQIKSMAEKESTEEHFFNEEQLIRVIGDLFSAGTETTSTTLFWTVLFLLHHPEIQKKLQQEIDDVITTDRPPTMADLVKMPYTEAFIKEVQRMGDIVPFSVPRCTTEDVELRGYTIPAGTSVWPNLNRVHFDPAVWGDPHNFRPERFLDDRGRLIASESLMPFCVGRRACLGESLARMELFLFTTSMLQKFTFQTPEGASLPGHRDGILGISYSPKPYEVCAVLRKVSSEYV